jgi:hypothetical protein
MMNNLLHSSLCLGTNLPSQRKQRSFARRSAILAGKSFLVGVGRLDAAKAAEAAELAETAVDGSGHNLADYRGADLGTEAAGRASVVDRCS